MIVPNLLGEFEGYSVLKMLEFKRHSVYERDWKKVKDGIHMLEPILNFHE